MKEFLEEYRALCLKYGYQIDDSIGQVVSIDLNNKDEVDQLNKDIDYLTELFVGNPLVDRLCKK